MAERSESWKRFIPKDRPKDDNRSDYIIAKAHVGGGVINTCPFGCPDHTLDDMGRCKHLIGNSYQPKHEGDRPTNYAPLKCQRHLDGTIQYDVLVTTGESLPILDSDILIPVSVDCMVYRRNVKEREAVAKHKIPDAMMTVLGVKNEDGETVPMTLNELQGRPKKTWSRKKKVKPVAETQSAV